MQGRVKALKAAGLLARMTAEARGQGPRRRARGASEPAVWRSGPPSLTLLRAIRRTRGEPICAPRSPSALPRTRRPSIPSGREAARTTARASSGGALRRGFGLPGRDGGEIGLGRPAADTDGIAAVALAERGELGPRDGAKAHAVDRRREALAVVEEKAPAGEVPVQGREADLGGVRLERELRLGR